MVRDNGMTNHGRVDAMLTICEMARLFDVHTSTVKRWSEQGMLKAYRIGPGGARRFRREEAVIFYLERVIKKHPES